jgi:hypothetical protein
MPSTFAGTIRTFLSLVRTVTEDERVETRTVAPGATYNFVAGGQNRLGADVVWSDTRSITGGTTETLDLLSLPDTSLTSPSTGIMRSVRMVRVANNMTITGPRVVVGPAPSNGWNRVAGDVGPGGELLAVQSVNHWPVGDTTRNLLIHATGATGATGLISYTITIVGSEVTGATGY